MSYATGTGAQRLEVSSAALLLSAAFTLSKVQHG